MKNVKRIDTVDELLEVLSDSNFKGLHVRLDFKKGYIMDLKGAAEDEYILHWNLTTPASFLEFIRKVFEKAGIPYDIV